MARAAGPGHPTGAVSAQVAAQDVLASISAPTLSAEQATAVAQIDADCQRFTAHVLRGVTGSGKTEVYLQCAERALARGRSVLVLVPEIALTPQLVERFRQRLPVGLSVLHSGLSDSERSSAWRAARSGDARIVLGTRSAVFAPLPRLGLIIVDEEHDSSYKQQEGGCRYSARDLAVVRAQQCQIPVVLGSATPAFETLQNLQSGRYRQLTLPRRERSGGAPLLKLVDLRAHAVRHGLSTPVVDAMRRHLRDRRAGAGVHQSARLCTDAAVHGLRLDRCPAEHCDARLTVHRASEQS